MKKRSRAFRRSAAGSSRGRPLPRIRAIPLQDVDFQTIFENLGDAAVLFDPFNQKFITINARAREYLGWNRKKTSQMSLEGIFAEEEIPRIPEYIRQVFVSGSARFRIRVRVPGGAALTDARINLVTVKRKKRFLIIARDITEQDRAENLLRRSEENFRHVAENSPNMIFIRDIAGNRNVYVNDQCVSLTGYSREELCSPSFDFLTLIAPESRDLVRRSLRRHSRGEEVSAYEYQLLLKDDRRLDTVITTKLIEFNGRQTLLGIITDITGRARTEQALRQSEERFRIAAQSTSDVIFEIDPSAGTFQWFGENLELRIGYRANELPRENADWNLFLHPEDLEQAAGEIRKAIAASAPLDSEYRIRRRDGGWAYWQFRAQPVMGVDGRPGKWIGVISDITQRKKAEEILMRDKHTLEVMVRERSIELIEAYAQLEKSRRLSDLGTLSATVAHELRNPLAAIAAASYNIRRKLGLVPVIARQVATIEKKVLESNHIIENMLGYSRANKIFAEQVKVQKLIDDCCESVLLKYPRWQVKFERDYDDGETELMADPAQLKMVFSNIIDNAFQAFPGKTGTITLRTRRSDGHAEITIADNGAGIAGEDLGKVFEPFFTRRSKGTGLGLALCREIVQLHGGTIGVTSQPGSGTEFVIRFPGAAAETV